MSDEWIPENEEGRSEIESGGRSATEIYDFGLSDIISALSFLTHFLVIFAVLSPFSFLI